MTLSQSAASNIVPLLARVVLALAFIPVGWNKMMKDAEFSGDAAKRLRELQVVVADSGSRPVIHASLLTLVPQEQPAAPPTGGSPPSKPSAPADDEPKPTPKPTTDESPKPAPAVSDPAAGTPVKARQLHNVTLLVDKAGWSNPVILAWLAAMTELVGGTLVLLGLFTRIWGLGLAITMGVAFYLTTLDPFLDSRVFGMLPADYSRFVSQISLFALAFGLVLSGAGPLSLDRMMFRGKNGGDGGSKKRDAAA